MYIRISEMLLNDGPGGLNIIIPYLNITLMLPGYIHEIFKEFSIFRLLVILLYIKSSFLYCLI